MKRRIEGKRVIPWVGIITSLLLLFTNTFAGQLRVSWQANSDADLAGYKVYYGETSGSYSQVIDVGNTTNRVVDGLQENQDYFFAITAYDTAKNESGFSTEVSGRITVNDIIAPQQPATPVCTVQQTKILVHWNANNDADLAGYLVRYGTQSGNYSHEENVGNVTSYTTPDLENGQTYYFVVIAYDYANNYSVASSEVHVAIQNDIDPPAIPVIASYSVIDDRATIKWQANSEPDLGGYKVFYGTESRDYTERVDVGNKTEFTTPTLMAGTTYYFTVFAYDQSQNESDFSPEIIISIATVDTTAPPEPTITGITLDQLKVKLTWNTVSVNDIDGYKVYYGTESRVYDISEDVKNLNSYTTQDLTEGQTYYFAVTAYDTASNESQFSAEQHILIENLDITPPTIYAVEIRDANTVNMVFSEEVERTSAENISNYTIQSGIQIQSVTLNETSRIAVIKTSAHQAGIKYDIFVSNVTDKAETPNAIAANSSSSYVYNPDDHTAPEITSVTVIDGAHINVKFSEELDRVSAEVKGNYSINRDVQVLSVLLYSSLREVMLTTTLHENHQEHTLTVNNIKDRAPVPNEIAANSSKTYVYHEKDEIAPEIYAVRMNSDTNIDIMFSEKVDKSSAENTTNYSINNNVQVISAVLDATGKIVNVTTTPHLSGLTYRLTINNVLDLAYPPNEISANSVYDYVYAPEDIVAPALLLVDIIDETHVDVTYSEDVDRQSAENTSNYAISNSISIVEVQLDNNRRVAHLVTSDHRAGKTYLITINGIKDRAPVPNTIANNSQLAYTYLVRDITAPTIENVVAVDVNTIEVKFSEIVDRTTAENLNNYTIDNGIQVLGVILYDDLKTVQLQTTAHNRNRTYTLVVNNIRDRSFPANTIASNSTVQYSFDSDTQSTGIIVANIDRNGYSLTTLKIKDTYYSDRSYIIESVPKELEKAYWIKTANDDRSNSSESFLTFDLKDDAKIYIGYDSRATEVPNWLKKNFTRTNKQIGVSEYAEHLIVWEKDCVKNTITLGGNVAQGAYGAESMYVVLVKANNVEQPPELENTDDPESMGKAEVYLLYQNYPNPFNAGTEIRFQLPEDCHVSLTIYNIIGQEVVQLVDGFKEAAHHIIRWDGKNSWGRMVPSGVYFSRIEVTRRISVNNSTINQVIYNDVRKMILLK